MTRIVSASDAQGVGTRTKYTHGLLMPVIETCYEWADKDAQKNKIPGTGGVIEYSKWLTLPDSKKGRKWTFEVDPRVLEPDLEWTVPRGIMLGFDEWNKVVLPSILDTIGQGDKSVGVFLDRARLGGWYVEAEMPYTGDYEGKPQNTFKFTRMTQDLEELKAWNLERYPKQELVPSAEQIATGKLVFNRLAHGNTDDFNTRINSDEELSPYLEAFAKNDYALVR